MEQIERIKELLLTWCPNYDEKLAIIDIKEGMQRICNYINDDVFPEKLEINLAKELSNIFNLGNRGILKGISSIKESETTVQTTPQPIDYDEIISNLKKVLFRFRKVK